MTQPVFKNNKPVERIEVIYVSPLEITPNKYNPNNVPNHEFELLKKSIKEDGFTQPIIVQELTDELVESDKECQQLKDKGIKGIIVDGEHRWKASQELELKEIPVVFVNFTEVQRMIATIRHNKARGNENLDLLAGVFSKIKELGGYEWALDSLRMKKGEWEKIISSYQNINYAATIIGQEKDAFNQSWEPSINHLQESSIKKEDNNEDDKKDNEEINENNYRREEKENVYVTSLTDEAYEEYKEIEEKLNNTESPIERQEIRQQIKHYKINLIFNGEEGEIIQYVIGDNPANKILQLCRIEYEKMISEK